MGEKKRNGDGMMARRSRIDYDEVVALANSEIDGWKGKSESEKRWQCRVLAEHYRKMVNYAGSVHDADGQIMEKARGDAFLHYAETGKKMRSKK